MSRIYILHLLAIIMLYTAGCCAISFTPSRWDDVHIDLYGYTKLDAFWDNQQMVTSRDGHFLIAPKPTRGFTQAEIAGNEQESFHFTTIESRFGIFAENDDWLSVSTRGRLEADFFGVTERDVASARMRHAYGEITQPHSFNFLFGQTWHPLFIANCYPYTLGFAFGAPTEFQARSPQVRLQKDIGPFAMTGALVSQQLSFISDGPDGLDTKYIRQSATPEGVLRADWYHKHGILGSAISIKSLTPRLQTQENLPTDEKVTGVTAELYGSWNTEYSHICAKTFYTQNATEHAMLGGYAGAFQDPETGRVDYVTIDAAGGWIDIETCIAERWYLGTLIAGISKRDEDLRFIKNADLGPFGILPRVESVLRASPRTYWQHENITFGMEIAIARAVYQDQQESQLVRTPETGVRALFVGYYHF